MSKIESHEFVFVPGLACAIDMTLNPVTRPFFFFLTSLFLLLSLLLALASLSLSLSLSPKNRPSSCPL